MRGRSFSKAPFLNELPIVEGRVKNGGSSERKPTETGAVNLPCGELRRPPTKGEREKAERAEVFCLELCRASVS